MVDSSGAVGNLDISLDILDPAGNVVFQKVKEEHGWFRGAVDLEGDYQVCVDNK